MRLLVWLARAALFFILFAFAMNNQQEAGVRWFFGQEWRAPMVFIVLAAFAFGCGFGVFAMVPSWWRHRRVARQHTVTPGMLGSGEAMASSSSLSPSASSSPNAGLESSLPHPPRDGL